MKQWLQNEFVSVFSALPGPILQAAYTKQDVIRMSRCKSMLKDRQVCQKELEDRLRWNPTRLWGSMFVDQPPWTDKTAKSKRYELRNAENVRVMREEDDASGDGGQ